MKVLFQLNLRGETIAILEDTERQERAIMWLYNFLQGCISYDQDCDRNRVGLALEYVTKSMLCIFPDEQLSVCLWMEFENCSQILANFGFREHGFLEMQRESYSVRLTRSKWLNLPNRSLFHVLFVICKYQTRSCTVYFRYLLIFYRWNCCNFHKYEYRKYIVHIVRCACWQFESVYMYEKLYLVKYWNNIQGDAYTNKILYFKVNDDRQCIWI